MRPAWLCPELGTPGALAACPGAWERWAVGRRGSSFLHALWAGACVAECVDLPVVKVRAPG